MMTICDLPVDLVEDEIISRLPMTSLRSVRYTCKTWNTLCKNRIFFGKPKKHFLMMDSWRICLMNFDLSKGGNPSIRQESILDQIQISNVFHCDGLLLCVLKDSSRLVVWNPYSGQTRWIEPRHSFQFRDSFSLGYDSNLNHKILRIFDEIHPVTSRHVLGFEIYCLSSGSWKFLDVVNTHWEILSNVRSVSLKGNTYFTAQKIITEGNTIKSFGGFFVCFDFTTERFGPLRPLPSQPEHGRFSICLSCVREDQLAVLYQQLDNTVEISVTDKISPDVVSWTKFLKLLIGSWVNPFSRSLFIDEEKKVAVVFSLELGKACFYQTAHVIGQDGYFKSVRIGEALNVDILNYCAPLVCSSYLPSLLQIKATNRTNGKNVIIH
ncbi:F-box/kelch-repeat protein [Raphanus sativus]|uniref:F-box/kelch-repeat protein At3g13680-like n=1 Tax=Raphanus sativus TaxID=3726 RepID=A0A9W3DHE1_RAPSA|nr:F-box/kelch-repeat protein At3g13680-like [Raphanus sativus]KAJ4903747.1 F-box/kelch-repeat protein [Raphanus sativus]